MTTKKFSIIHVSGLSLANTHALINSTVEAATQIIPSPYGELVNVALQAMQITCNELGQQMNKVSKNPLTQIIDEQAHDREWRWSEIKTNIVMHEKGRNPEKRAMANNLHILMEPYWNMNKEALNTQTDQIRDMLAKCTGNRDLDTMAIQLGIASMLVELGTANNELDALYKQRTAQEGEKTGPSASSLKSAAVKSYTQFCTVVEQVTNLTPKPELTSLFNTMDELRKKYAVLVGKPEVKSVSSTN